jgi:hypothetical protein
MALTGCRTPIKIILEFDGYLLCHAASWLRWGYPHRTRSTVMAADTRGAASHLTGCTAPGLAPSAQHRASPRP